MQRKKWLKWLGIGMGSLVGLFLLLAILVPLFVDVDKYRPEIISAAEENLNGKLELGKLSLSLWGRLRVNVDGFSLSDSSGHKVVAAKDVFFEVPFGSLLVGSPSVTLNLKEPELYVHREANGDLNVSQLAKATGEEGAEGKPSEPSEPSEVPGIVAAARLGIALTNANLVYEDKKADLRTQVKDFNVIAKNLSLSSPSDLEVWAQIDTVVNKELSIKGPARFTASAKPELEGGRFKEARVDFKADINDLEIQMKDTFEKPKGVEAWMAGTLIVGTERAACKDLEVRFHNASLKGDGEVRGLKNPPMQIAVKVETPSVELAPWKKLVVALRPYDVSGTVGLKATAEGPLDKLDYRADLSVKSASFSGAGLLEKPVVDASILVRPERVEKFSLTMKAPGNDLRVAGSVVSFKAPKVKIDVASKGMDLDRLMKFEKSAAGQGEQKASKQTPSSDAVDFDAMLDPIRKNGILKKATGVLNVNMASVRMMNVAITSIQSRMSMKQLVFNLEKFGLGIFGGKVGANGTVNLQGKAPTYSLNVDVNGADLRQAVESQFAPFKNTLVGKGFFKMAVKGKSFNPPAAKANLAGQGNMRVEGARFNTIDIGRVATEAVNKALTDVASKVPELRGKQINAPKAVESEYESVNGNFTIQQSVFSAPDFFAKAVANKGLDIRGRTAVNLTSDALEADWELRDTYNTLNARDMSIKIADQVVPQILAKDGVVVLPVQVRGTVTDPKVTYTSVPEALARVALDNIKKAAENRAKAEVQKAVQNEAKKLIKGLFK